MPLMGANRHSPRTGLSPHTNITTAHVSSSYVPPPPPVLGWTPRAPSASHSYIAQGTDPSPSSVSAVPGASVNAPPPPPPPAPPTPGPHAQTPSWLKGAYRPGLSGAVVGASANTGSLSVEGWCKQRLEAIRQTAEGVGATPESAPIPELRKVMETIEYAKIERETEARRAIRRQFWRIRERQDKAALELRRAEREVARIDVQSQNIDVKIARLRGYSRFIENGWKDPEDDAMDISVPAPANAPATSVAAQTVRAASTSIGD